MAGKPAERDGVEAQRNVSSRRAWSAFQKLLKGAVQGGQQPTARLGRSEGPAGLEDDSLGGPEGLEAGGAAWGQREVDSWGRQRGGVLPGRRAETWKARETSEESTEESGTFQPAPGQDGHRQRWTERSSLQRYHLVNNLGYTHLFI